MRTGRSSRIQTTIALAFAAIVFCTALVMAVLSYSFTEEAVQRTSLDYTAELITQVQSSIDSYITHMENIAEVVQLNEQVQTFFSSGETVTPEQEQQYRARIMSFLNSISRTRNDISLILVAGADGRVLTHDPGITLNPSVIVSEQPWFRAALESSGRAVVSPSHVQNVVEGEYRWVITLSRTINDPATGTDYGVMLVDLNFSVINELVNRIGLGKKGYLFIVDSGGRIVYHPRQELIYSNLEREYIDLVLERAEGSFAVTDDRGQRIYTVSTSRRVGWRTVGVNYASEMVRNRDTILRYYIFGAFLCVVLAILVSVLISHRLSRPIMRLRSSMQAVEQGSFDISVDVSSNNEIGDLARDFTIMITQIRELMCRNAEEQEQKRRSELLALQNQITPHFLYNTLDSVIWMAEGKQYANVVKTVSALARLLRLSVSRGDELVSIRDEIGHIKNYLTIQKMRYRDKIDFAIEVDRSIMRLRTPKVILQPLVENAIYHGIKNKDDGGRVTVSGTLRGSQVVLSVCDDGVGMSDEQLESLIGDRTDRSTADVSASVRTAPGQTPPDTRPFASGPGAPGSFHAGPYGERLRLASGNGSDGSSDHRNGRLPGAGISVPANALRPPGRRPRVGVRNVHERIQLYFGDQYGLYFRRNGESGTVVEVRLPIVEPNGERDE